MNTDTSPPIRPGAADARLALTGLIADLADNIDATDADPEMVDSLANLVRAFSAYTQVGVQVRRFLREEREAAE